MKHKKILVQGFILFMSFCFILIGPIFGQSRVSKLSEEEFIKLLGEKTVELGIQQTINFPFSINYPAAIDWRNKGGQCYVTKPKDQLSCGSCVAFDAVSTLESLVLIENNRTYPDIDLSEMDVFNCGGGICGTYGGWTNDAALRYLNSSGAPDETCWPYTPTNMPCSNSCPNWQKRAITIENGGYILGIEQCKTMVAQAPIMAVMAVYPGFQGYYGGIYERGSNTTILGYHSVSIVGYDHDSFQGDYWIVKNSWGEDWGENGFFRIKMGECGIETLGNYWMSDAMLPLKPETPSNLTATANSNPQVILKWQDNSDKESGFEVQRKVEGGAFSTITKKGENSTTYSDNGVSFNTAYDYQVRAYNAAGYSAFSNTVKITTPTQAITVVSPNGSESWNCGSTYAIQWTSNNVTNVKIELLKAGVPVTANLPSSVTASLGSYSWTIPATLTTGSDYKIRITDSANPSVTDSSNANFSIIDGGVPDNPILNSPANNATVCTLRPTFKWEAVTACPVVNYYQVQINIIITPGEPSTKLYVSTNIASTSYTLPANILEGGKNYKWFVRAHNAEGWGDWSGRNLNITVFSVPVNPILNSPADNATVSTTRPTFTWSAISACPAVDYYQVQVNIVPASGGPSTKLYVSANLTATSFTMPANILESGKKYKWFVRAHNAEGWGDWSGRNIIIQ